MSTDRKERIQGLIEEKGEIRLRDLNKLFPELSTMTLRRDLDALEKEGLVIRTHGGAVSVKRLAGKGEENPYEIRAQENKEAKQAIAEKVMHLVEEGRSLYFDSGSTIMSLAEILPNERFSVLTSGLNIALEVQKRSLPTVMTVGGLINRNTLSASGPAAIKLLESVNIDLAFMAASGFSVDRGFTVANVYESELKKAVVREAREVIVLIDSSKIDKNLPFTYATLSEIDAIACERPLPPEVEAAIRQANVKIY
ncbi:MAG: DeoR/GlpR transcriptional regulator [Firmicutes bacterium]|nr:DeoR/GlpR transcriptional regulator [Bacillota bacterium]